MYRYILEAHDLIELCLNNYKPLLLKEDENDLMIAIGHLSSEEDYKIVEQIINISNKIKILFRSDNKLKKKYPNSIIIRNIPIKNYLLDVDIFLPTFSTFNTFLVKNKKLFSGSIYSSNTYYSHDCEILLNAKDKYGKLMQKVNTPHEVCEHQFGDVLSDKELEELFYTKVEGTKKTIFFIKLALENRAFLKKCCELSLFYNNWESLNDNSKYQINDFINILNKSI